MLNKKQLLSELIATRLPVTELIDSIRESLRHSSNLIIQAEPGAGKTTVVPLALLESIPDKEKILILEPRRLAATNAAYRMADLCKQKVGHSVGYRIRNQHKVSPDTQIEVITEGILTRMIQTDPELRGIAMIIFDEFHERSIHADLGLALSLEIQQTLREDLRLIVMSATLNLGALSQVMNQPPIIRSHGRNFPVDIEYLAVKTKFEWLSVLPAAVNQLLALEIASDEQEKNKDILVFLPGISEIQKALSLLENSNLAANNVVIMTLYGTMPIAEQQKVLTPQASKIKIILATNIAETSLTIEGIGFVIDSGLQRQSYFDPNVGFNRLKTSRVSLASAQQRAGRAGRLSAGKCIRLWSESEVLREHSLAEIQRSDLANLVLELAKWGTTRVDSTLLIEMPNPGALNQARSLLCSLKAIDRDFKITQYGAEILNFGVHPRLGHMLIQSVKLNLWRLACLIAAMLEEKDVFFGERKNDPDFVKRIEFVLENSSKAISRIKQQAKRLESKLSKFACQNLTGNDSDLKSLVHRAGVLLAFAFPERIATVRGLGYLLANGSGARIKERVFNSQDFIVVVELGGETKATTVFQAAPLNKEDFQELYSDLIQDVESVEWDPKQQRVVAEKCRQYLQLKFARQPLSSPSQELVQQALVAGIRQQGIESLPWSKENEQWISRVYMLAKIQMFEQTFPLLSKTYLEQNLHQWLQPFLTDCKSLKDISSLTLTQALTNILDWSQQQQLDSLMPRGFRAPSGSVISIDYCQGEKPVLAVKLQEMFGEKQTPKIANGKISLLVHLLSPARRPIQITEDLAGFWQSSYQDVKKDMKGRYPKHPWPDDPLKAKATRLTKNALGKLSK